MALAARALARSHTRPLRWMQDRAGLAATPPAWRVKAPSARGLAAAAATTGLQPAAQQQAQAPPQPQHAGGMSSSETDSDSSSGPVRVPLKLVVADAVKRWFNETLSEAWRGDVKQQALLAQMYAEGYGCTQDLEESRRWQERARQRGYQMSGVYCEL